LFKQNNIRIIISITSFLIQMPMVLKILPRATAQQI
jgi:hypothetical protein